MKVMQRECVIVGGGVMGSAVGLALAQAGMRATILERAVPGAEASSAAAGILSPHAESHHLGALLSLALESLRLYPRWAQDLSAAVGIDIGYRVSGVLDVALADAEPRALAAFTERARLNAAAGFAVEELSGEALRKLEPALSPRIARGLRYPDDAQVDPRALLHALSMAAARAGAEFISGRVVERVVIEGERVRGVALAGELIETARVIIAAGSWSSQIPGLERVLAPGAVKPARGQMAAVQTRPPIARHVVFGPRGYLVPRPDGRVLLGSTTEFVGYEKQLTPAGLRAVFDQAIELVPALGDAPVVETWSGLRPFHGGGAPLIGPTAIEGLTLATGHFRNGILLAPVTAEMVCDHLLARPTRFSLPTSTST